MTSVAAAGIRISDDPGELDRERIHQWLSEQSYWATGRPRAKQDAAIDGSWCFGAYDEATGEQVAFARLVTDRATFAWLCDVFVDDAARGNRVGIALIDAIVHAVEPLGVRRVLLATADAHGLYERFGFEPIQHPERWMVLTSDPTA